MPTPKQKALAWARMVWGPDGLAAKDKLGRYLIGRAEDGFLGPGIRYYGLGTTWEEALTDAQTNWALRKHRGWTNAVSNANLKAP